MESVQDSFNTKIDYLVKMKEAVMKLYQEYENERKAIFSRANFIEKSAKENFDQDLRETCRITKVILEELRIDTFKNDKTVHVEKEADSDQVKQGKKKCRYFNRGFCKYGENCRFHHPKQMCSEYLQEGICRQWKCQQRHPRDCRYWTGKQEGCKRGESCQYLHLHLKRYSEEQFKESCGDKEASRSNVVIVENSINCN